MLGELEALSLVVGAEAGAVEAFRFGQHVFVDQATDDLAVFENEGDFVASDFENRAAAGSAGAGVAEACLLYTSPSPRDS